MPWTVGHLALFSNGKVKNHKFHKNNDFRKFKFLPCHILITHFYIYILLIFIIGNQCDLTDPFNGKVNCSNNTATYLCDPCWQLVGNERRTFTEDGIWTGYKPICSK